MTRDPNLPKSGERPIAGRSDAAPASTSADVAAFVAKARAMAPGRPGSGRLIFALDATMSRQPTWDTAQQLQAEMFREAAAIGGLDIQLVYFRGMGECRSSAFVADADRLSTLMSRIDCRGGHTQIAKVLSHTRKEHKTQAVQALVYVGDAMEEAVDDLAAAAGELGLLGVPVFMFQEGRDPVAENAFREIARLSRGAYSHFDPGAAHQLAELLRAVAAYAAGGMKALTALSSRQAGGAQLLLAQLRR